MKYPDYRKLIGTSVVFSVKDGKVSLVQHESTGMKQIKLPVTSLLQSVSEFLIRNEEFSQEDMHLIAEPYINRAVQHGVAIIKNVAREDIQIYLDAVQEHPRAEILGDVFEKDGNIYISTKY